MLGRQKQEDLCESEASLVYDVSSRTARAVRQRNSVSKNKQANEKILDLWLRVSSVVECLPSMLLTL